ncbi:hypothetical protein L249_6291, partial [Ophiocordyceps polyrhachis-furcata BCC 54312]
MFARLQNKVVGRKQDEAVACNIAFLVVTGNIWFEGKPVDNSSGAENGAQVSPIKRLLRGFPVDWVLAGGVGVRTDKHLPGILITDYTTQQEGKSVPYPFAALPMRCDAHVPPPSIRLLNSIPPSPAANRRHAHKACDTEQREHLSKTEIHHPARGGILAIVVERDAGPTNAPGFSIHVRHLVVLPSLLNTKHKGSYPHLHPEYPDSLSIPTYSVPLCKPSFCKRGPTPDYNLGEVAGRDVMYGLGLGVGSWAPNAKSNPPPSPKAVGPLGGRCSPSLGPGMELALFAGLDPLALPSVRPSRSRISFAGLPCSRCDSDELLLGRRASLVPGSAVSNISGSGSAWLQLRAVPQPVPGFGSGPCWLWEMRMEGLFYHFYREAAAAAPRTSRTP